MGVTALAVVLVVYSLLLMLALIFVLTRWIEATKKLVEVGIGVAKPTQKQALAAKKLSDEVSKLAAAQGATLYGS